jgi:hypothetical protein
MKLVIETVIKTVDNRELETFSTLIDSADIQKIINKQGVEAANKAIENFSNTYHKQFNKKLSASLNKL